MEIALPSVQAWTAIIAKNLFESARLLTNTMPLFADKCLRGLVVHTEHNRKTAENSLGLSTVVGGVYGYEAGARAAHHAAEHGTSIKDAVIDELVAEQRARTRELVAGMPTRLRIAIYSVTSSVAAADSDITNQEEQALRVVADALELGETPLTGADSVTATAETELLAALRASLQLAPETAEALQSKIDALRAGRRKYLPRSEQLPWWEEFGELMRRLHALPASESRGSSGR